MSKKTGRCPWRRFIVMEEIVLKSKPDPATGALGQRGTVVGYGGHLLKLLALLPL